MGNNKGNRKMQNLMNGLTLIGGIFIGFILLAIVGGILSKFFVP